MMSPPHTGEFDVGEAEQAPSQVYGGQTSEVFLSPMLSPQPKAKSRARSLCTWKDCHYRGCNTDEMR